MPWWGQAWCLWSSCVGVGVLNHTIRACIANPQTEQAHHHLCFAPQLQPITDRSFCSPSKHQILMQPRNLNPPVTPKGHNRKSDCNQLRSGWLAIFCGPAASSPTSALPPLPVPVVSPMPTPGPPQVAAPFLVPDAPAADPNIPARQAFKLHHPEDDEALLHLPTARI